MDGATTAVLMFCQLLQQAGIPVSAIVVALLGTLGVDRLRPLMRLGLPPPSPSWH
jgi:hypothetical protein